VDEATESEERAHWGRIIDEYGRDPLDLEILNMTLAADGGRLITRPVDENGRGIADDDGGNSAIFIHLPHSLMHRWPHLNIGDRVTLRRIDGLPRIMV
jgi:hypothetical protein